MATVKRKSFSQHKNTGFLEGDLFLIQESLQWN